MNKLSFVLLSIVIYLFACVAPSIPHEEEKPELSYSIHKHVTNAEEDYFKAIFQLWQDYLDSDAYVHKDQDYWDQEVFPRPDYSYINLLLDLRRFRKDNISSHCTLLGIIPVKENYFMLKSVFSKRSTDTNRDEIGYMLTVYAKKVGDTFKLVNSTQYQKARCENIKIGVINYVLHPSHIFNKAAAQKMLEYNLMMAEKFEVPPIEFTYVLANTTRELSEMMGYDYNMYTYNPVQSGGLADNYNKVIYAGNNSEYYPHEVVHLYTYAKFQGNYHTWVDEGIAAYFGGSTGYEIAWHIQKLKIFLSENEDYALDKLSDLEKDIPNGEFTTDFRYAIGGFLMQQIFEKEGMQGFFDVLQSGRSEDEYFIMLKHKLGVVRAEFGEYIKNELSQINLLTQAQMDHLKY